MLTHIDSKMDPIQSSLSRIHNSLSSLGDQVNLLEQRVGANEDNVHECVARVKQLEKDNSFLMSKVDDLENRSRRSNLRFVGIQESAEGSDIIGFMSQLIPQLLGPDAFPTLPIIERAHRSPTARQNSRASPRAIMIELLNFQDKVKILRLAREKKSLDYNGKHISIYPDFSPELTRRRRSFDPVKRKLRELNLKYFLSSFEALTTTLNGLNSTVAGHGERIGSLEDNSNEVDRRLQHLENACSTLQQDNVLLKTKLADLEGRSRRQNIRIIGLPESLEGPRPTAFFSQLLVDVFGKEVLSSPPELDRAHRSLAPKPAAGDKPRPVTVRLHHFQVKDLLIREARRRGELFYKEHKIRLYEDYSSDVLKERAEYKSSMAELYKRGYRPALLYPAKLRITLPNCEKTWIRSVLETDKFLQNLN
ncbi:hypothetical protein JOQ06_028845, partial [Pogonophryne albipinna]